MEEELKTSGPSARLSVRSVLFGLTVLAALKTLSLVEFFPYRPWISVPFVFWLEIVVFFFLFTYAALMLKRAGYWPLFRVRSVRWLLTEAARAVLYAFVIGTVAGIAGMVLEIFIDQPIAVPEPWGLARHAPGGLINIAFLIMGVTVAPVVEEVFFRGFLYGALRERMRRWYALSLQAFVFSAAHLYSLTDSVVLFLIGLGLALVYERRKTLIAPILVHAGLNAVATAPMLVIAIMNFHMPASTWDEAKTPPSWLDQAPPAWVEKHSNAHAQLRYAVNTWGETGSTLWKREANALNTVWRYYPDARVTVARARVELARVYFFDLCDYRRAILEADNVIEHHRDERRESADAWALRGWAYYMLRDFPRGRESFETVLSEYPESEEAVRRAREGLRWLAEIGER